MGGSRLLVCMEFLIDESAYFPIVNQRRCKKSSTASPWDRRMDTKLQADLAARGLLLFVAIRLEQNVPFWLKHKQGNLNPTLTHPEWCLCL